MSADPRVYQRGSETWTADFYLSEPGKPKRRERHALPAAKTLDEALVAARSLRDALNRRIRGGPPPRTLTLAQFKDELWLPRRKYEWKPATWRGYEQILRIHLLPAFGDSLLTEIRPEAIEDYKVEKRGLKLNPSTVNKHLGVLSKMLNDAVLWGQLSTSPMARVENCRLNHDPDAFDYLQEDEQTSLLAATLRLRPRWYPLFLTALLTGMRLGELAALTRGDLDLNAKVLKVARAFSNGDEGTTKSRRHRPIPLVPMLVEVLRAHLASQPGDRVFVSNEGAILTHNNVKSTWRTVQKAAGIDPLRFHDARHTFASQLVMHDVSLPKVQALLGHSDQRTTQRYAHINVQSLRDAVDRLPTPGISAPAATK